MLITISNLYPRPDQPTRGMFNAQLFGEMAVAIGIQNPESRIQNVCLVPSWKLWQWPAIRKWKEPERVSSERPSAQPLTTQQLNNPAISSLSTAYIPVFYLPVVGRLFNDVFYALTVRNWAKTVKPGDVVYIPWLYPDGVAVERVLRGRGARVWLMALGSDTLRLQEARCRQKIVEACSASEGVVCVAQVLADRLAAAGVPREKLHVVPNGVDTSLFRPRSKEAATSSLKDPETPHLNPLPQGERKSGAPTILFIGNLVPVKGPDILLKAFAKIFEQKSQRAQREENRISAGGGKKNSSFAGFAASVQISSSPNLVVIGSGPLRAKLERQAQQLGISDRVHFLGNRSHLEVARWMNVADVLCLASRNEGMPNVVLEARASGLPVVATPAGAIPELPLDKEHFLVVKSCSPEDLAAGLQEMLGRDLSNRKPDPAISTWGGMAERVLALMQEKAGLSV